jgi:hypothetical protein
MTKLEFVHHDHYPVVLSPELTSARCPLPGRIVCQGNVNVSQRKSIAYDPMSHVRVADILRYSFVAHLEVVDSNGCYIASVSLGICDCVLLSHRAGYSYTTIFKS